MNVDVNVKCLSFLFPVFSGKQGYSNEFGEGWNTKVCTYKTFITVLNESPSREVYEKMQ